MGEIGVFYSSEKDIVAEDEVSIEQCEFRVDRGKVSDGSRVTFDDEGQSLCGDDIEDLVVEKVPCDEGRGGPEDFSFECVPVDGFGGGGIENAEMMAWDATFYDVVVCDGEGVGGVLIGENKDAVGGVGES